MQREYTTPKRPSAIRARSQTDEAETPERVTEAPVEKTWFTDAGDKPPVAGRGRRYTNRIGARVRNQRFRSRKPPVRGTRQHPELVAAFNKLTDNVCVACIVNPEKFATGSSHGVRADGKITTSTVSKANASAVVPEKAATPRRRTIRRARLPRRRL